MNKPLGDWTLSKTRTYCESRDTCVGCALALEYCKLDDMGIPAEWPESSNACCDPDTMIPKTR